MTTVMTGAKAIFSLAGVKVGFSSQVQYNENIAYEPINVLDKLEVLEHAETGYTVDLSVQNFRVPNASVKQLGIMSKLPQILTQGELDAVLIDKVTGATILLMTGVKIQARQTTVDARGVMTETWNFVARQATDESNAG